MIDSLHKSYDREKVIQTGEKGFVSYITNTLNRIGMRNKWVEQLQHDNSKQLKKPTINKVFTLYLNSAAVQI